MPFDTTPCTAITHIKIARVGGTKNKSLINGARFAPYGPLRPGLVRAPISSFVRPGLDLFMATPVQYGSPDFRITVSR